MVEFSGAGRDWVVNHKAMSKRLLLSPGSCVRVKTDKALVKSLQPSHGGWVEEMSSVLGKTGQVIKVYYDGDVRVSFGLSAWTFNPQCLEEVSGDSSGRATTSQMDCKCQST